jgi:hypothetical protein
MADSDISGLPVTTTLENTDLLAIVGDTTTVPETQHIIIQDFISEVNRLNGGLAVTEDKFNFTDITTANSSTSKHGLLPKLSGNSNQALKGDGTFGGIPETGLVISDNTTGNASTSAHGLLPKLSGNSNQFLTGAGTYTAITENGLSLSDVTTGNASSTKHGLLPKLSNNKNQSLKGDGAWGNTREVITANRTYYVRYDGSDSNDGLSISSAGAFLTIQHAIDIASSLDLGNYTVTIQITSNTWNENLILKSFVGSGSIVLIGDETTPSNVTISTTLGAAGTGIITADSVSGLYEIRGVKLTSATTSKSGLLATNNSVIKFQNIEFGSLGTNGYHLTAQDGAVISATGNYTITGGATYHCAAIQGGLIRINGRTITISGTPAFATAFIYASNVSAIRAMSMIFSGSATGTRYVCETNSVVYTQGGGASYFPGSVAGSIATGGQYT